VKIHVAMSSFFSPYKGGPQCSALIHDIIPRTGWLIDVLYKTSQSILQDKILGQPSTKNFIGVGLC
jgi:hypothetical protein